MSKGASDSDDPVTFMLDQTAAVRSADFVK